MAKNRHIVESDIIKELDASFSAPDFIETDQILEVKNTNGIYQYKRVSGEIVARTQAEIDADYLPVYIAQKIDDARELLYTRWPDSSKTIAANQARYQSFKGGTYADIAAVDSEYDDFVTFLDLS